MKIFFSSILLFLIIFSTETNAEQGNQELAKQIRECAVIAKSKQRIDCYDQIAKHLDNSAVKNSTTKTASGSSTPTTTLPETLGGSRFDKDNKESPINRGKVVSCKRASDKRWFFIFENGQVWKQTDRRQRFFSDCNFNVTVQQDGFGYVMAIESKKSKIRIRRTR